MYCALLRRLDAPHGRIYMCFKPLLRPLNPVQYKFPIGVLGPNFSSNLPSMSNFPSKTSPLVHPFSEGETVEKTSTRGSPSGNLPPHYCSLAVAKLISTLQHLHRTVDGVAEPDPALVPTIIMEYSPISSSRPVACSMEYEHKEQ